MRIGKGLGRGLNRRDMLKSAMMAGASFTSAMGLDLAGMERVLAATLSGPLLISNWPYYIDKNTVPNFEKQFAIKVNYIEDINDNDSLFGKIAGPLQAGQNPGRDVIVPTGYMVDRLVKLGWLEKFSHDEIPTSRISSPALRIPAGIRIWNTACPGRRSSPASPTTSRRPARS